MLFNNIGLIDENFKYQPDMYVGVIGDTIAYVGKLPPEDDLLDSFGEVYDGSRKVMVPGFYNGHTHSTMTLMRGYGEGLPLDRWLGEKIFPFEAKLYNKAVYWSTLLAMAESARNGIVSSTDMYNFPDSIIRAISVSGEKINFCRAVTNFTGEPPQNLESFKEMVDSVKMYDGFLDGKVKIDTGIHAEYTSDDATARAVSEIAAEYDLRVHLHVAETLKETEACKERRSGMTPVEYMNYVGLFDQPAVVAHAIWLTEKDIDILKEKKVTVANCPASNLKLNSGICDVPSLYANGVQVTLGTDGVSSNNSLDCIGDMKLMALLGKHKGNDPSLMLPEQVLYSATRAGALSQGREDCGLIKEGFKADIAVIDMNAPNMVPANDVPANIVFAASGKDVVLTMVDGLIVYRDGEYPTIDVEKVYAEVEIAKAKIMSQL